VCFQAQEGGESTEDKEVASLQILLLHKMECIFLDLPSYLRRNALPLGICFIGQDGFFGLLAETREPEIANMLIEHPGVPNKMGLWC